jgi:uncharacterized RDD family membrane protein YckC
MTGVSPGWYRDPAAPETQRYWDGEQWLGAPIPADATPPATPPVAPQPAAPWTPPNEPAAPWKPSGEAASPWKPSGEPAAPWKPSDEPARLPPNFPTAAPTSPPPVPAPAPAPAGRAPLPPGIMLAPLGTRLIARFIDLSAIILLNVLVNGYFFYLYYQEMAPISTAWANALLNGDPLPALTESDKAQQLKLIMAVISIGLWFAYEVPATANSGQTLGKRLLGIKVTRIDGQPFTFWQSIRRWFIVGLPSIIGACAWPLSILDALWCTWDRPAQQCLHDKVVQTVVVLAPPSPDPNKKP